MGNKKIRDDVREREKDDRKTSRKREGRDESCKREKEKLRERENTTGESREIVRTMRIGRWENEAEEGGEKFEGYERGNLERTKTEEDEIGKLGREDNEMTKQKKTKTRKCRRKQEEPKMIGEEQREIVRERMKMTSGNAERDG